MKQYLLNVKYVDLFCGIGGFHQALNQLGGECVFACEINKETAETYEINYGIKPHGDIKMVDPLKDVPAHDIMCAGFPCQSFSKAGKQNGFSDERGVLFLDILRILKSHISLYGGPKILFLENVKNIASHDKGNTWKVIKHEIEMLGYNVINTPIIVSPHDFGVPQTRERAIIFACRKDFFQGDIVLNMVKKKRNLSGIDNLLEINVDPKYHISIYEKEALDVWEDFIHTIKPQVIGFPIWVDYFYSQYKKGTFPKWKEEIIQRNITFYNKYKSIIDEWYSRNNKLEHLKPTDRKFEWQAGTSISSIYEGIIQFRPSGIRVKRETEFPTLVAMIHKPIIGKECRFITPREAARIQSFPDDFILPQNDRLAYRQFGNAVNVVVIKQALIHFLTLTGGISNGRNN